MWHEQVVHPLTKIGWSYKLQTLRIVLAKLYVSYGRPIHIALFTCTYKGLRNTKNDLHIFKEMVKPYAHMLKEPTTLTVLVSNKVPENIMTTLPSAGYKLYYNEFANNSIYVCLPTSAQFGYTPIIPSGDCTEGHPVAFICT